jgi:hypothetical protein
MAPIDAPDGGIEGPNDASERSPLLPKPAAASAESVGSADSSAGDDRGPAAPRKYNKAQVVLLSCVRMIDPIAFFCIVPFVNQMIFDTGEIPEEDVGFYSGLIVGRPHSLCGAVELLTRCAGIALLRGPDVHHDAVGEGQRPVRPEARAGGVADRADLHDRVVRVQPECLADDRAAVCSRSLLGGCCVGGSGTVFGRKICSIPAANSAIVLFELL